MSVKHPFNIVFERAIITTCYKVLSSWTFCDVS